MKRLFLLVLFSQLGNQVIYSQSNFLVSSPAEIKMNGFQNYFFISHKSFLIYYPDSSNLKMVINMYDLKDNSNAKLPGIEVEYNMNILDTNSLIFEGKIDEKKIRPTHHLKDTYTFSITGVVQYKGNTYATQLVCSYGNRMLLNPSQTSINANLEILKMDIPMYVQPIKGMIDNLQIKIEDGTVNMLQH